MHKEFIDPKLLKLLTTFDSQLDDCDYGKYGGIKYFCHEYMRNPMGLHGLSGLSDWIYFHVFYKEY